MFVANNAILSKPSHPRFQAGPCEVTELERSTSRILATILQPHTFIPSKASTALLDQWLCQDLIMMESAIRNLALSTCRRSRFPARRAGRTPDANVECTVIGPCSFSLSTSSGVFDPPISSLCASRYGHAVQNRRRQSANSYLVHSPLTWKHVSQLCLTHAKAKSPPRSPLQKPLAGDQLYKQAIRIPHAKDAKRISQSGSQVDVQNPSRPPSS